MSPQTTVFTVLIYPGSDAESCHGCVKQVSLHRISFHSCPFLNCNIPSWVPVFGRAKFGNKYIILELGDNTLFTHILGTYKLAFNGMGYHRYRKVRYHFLGGGKSQNSNKKPMISHPPWQPSLPHMTTLPPEKIE